MIKSVTEAIFKFAESTPKKICVVDDRSSVTYAEFKNKILKIANFLVRIGVSKTDKAIIESSQSIDYLSLIFAINSIGAISVPIQNKIETTKLRCFIERVSPKIVITNSQILSDIKDNFSKIEFYKKDDILEICKNYDSLKLESMPAPENISDLLFTTGTTGSEKGILLSNSNNIALAENIVYALGITDQEVELILSPLNHSHGLRRFYADMLKGCTVVLQENFIFVKDLIDKIERFKVTAIDLVPAALKILLTLTKEKLKDYSSQIRYIQLSSAPTSKSDLETVSKLLPYTKIFNLYGSTESGVSCVYEINPTNIKNNCIGKPTYNSEILIVDKNKKEISSSIHNPGLLACRSKANMISYYGENINSYLDVLKNGVVYSNDIAYIDDDGDIILIGRKNDVISIGGIKVSPNEIEDVAIRYPLISDSACIPINDDLKGNVPKLFIVLKKEVSKEDFDCKHFKIFLEKNLEHFKVPSAVEIIDKIPRTYKGSVQRALLK